MCHPVDALKQNFELDCLSPETEETYTRQAFQVKRIHSIQGHC